MESVIKTPLGQLYQSPPSHIPGDLGRGPRHHFFSSLLRVEFLLKTDSGYPNEFLWNLESGCPNEFLWNLVDFWDVHPKNPPKMVSEPKVEQNLCSERGTEVVFSRTKTTKSRAFTQHLKCGSTKESKRDLFHTACALWSKACIGVRLGPILEGDLCVLGFLVLHASCLQRVSGVFTGGTDHNTKPGLLFSTPRARSSTILAPAPTGIYT